MNTRERFVRTLTGEDVDRVPFIKVFGGDNAMLQHWEKDCPGLSKNIDKILGFEGTYRGWATTPVNFGMTRREAPVLIAKDENDQMETYRYPDGTVVMKSLGEAYHSQTLEWPVKNRADWERFRDRYLQTDDPARFPENWSELVDKYRQRDYPLQLTHGGVYGFPRNLMGDVGLMYAFYDDPDLVHDIMDYWGIPLTKVPPTACAFHVFYASLSI